MNNKTKGYLTLISAVLFNLLSGNLFSFPNFIPYYRSYLYYKNDKKEKISLLKLYFIAPVGICILNTLPTVTGFLDNKFGTRVSTILGAISLLGSQLIMYFFTDYYLLIIAYVLFGFTGSLTYFQTLKNCWKYFPGKEGLMSGIIFSCFGFSSFAFTSLGDFIINPKSEKKVDDNYYSEKVANRFLDFTKFYIICIIIMGTLSSFLCFTYQEEQTKNVEKEKDEKEANEKITTGEKETDGKENEKEEKLVEHYEVKLPADTEKVKGDKKLTLKQALLSLDFVQCLSIAGCTLIFGFLLSNTYRNFGVTKDLNELGMQILSKAFTILNTFSRLVWGVICDKFGFKIPYIIICINQLICGILIYFSAGNIYTYFPVVCFGVLSYAGHIIFFPNLIKMKFGVDNSVILMGITGIFSGISCMMGPVLTFFIIKDIKDYLKVYLIGIGPTVISLILTFFIKVKKKEKSEQIINEEQDEPITNEGKDEHIINEGEKDPITKEGEKEPIANEGENKPITNEGKDEQIINEGKDEHIINEDTN